MNGPSAFQEVRSSPSRSVSHRILHEQWSQFGKGSGQLHDDHDHTAFGVDINAQVETVPSTCSVITQHLIHGFLFFLVTISTGGNALAQPFHAEPLTEMTEEMDVVDECVDGFFDPMVDSSISRLPIPSPPPPDPLQIVVGCRLTNCGLQARIDSPIELRINVKSDLVASTVLSIENMSTTDAAGIEILQGEVDRREPLQWTIGPGVTRLRGFSVTREMPPPVITFRPLPNETRVLALTQEFRERRGLGNQNIGKIEIDVDQLLYTSVVRRKRTLVKLGFCKKVPETPNDRITLQNHPGTPNPTVLLNGRRSDGCIDLKRRAKVESHSGDSNIFLENMLSNGMCSSEASIFLQDRAMRLKVIDSNAPTWTDAPTDIVPVDMQQPPIQVPVNLWVLWPNGSAQVTVDMARTDLQEANTLYGNTQSGIQFFMPSGSPEVHINSNFWNATCADAEVSGLPQVGYGSNQLNVYYVGSPPPGEDEQATGWHCGTVDENIIIIRTAIERRATLAHELGHALSLQSHANDLVSQIDEKGNTVFDKYNIMWARFSPTGFDDRYKLTKGQSFRGNVYPGSPLYRLALPNTAVPPPGRGDCTESYISEHCPWIGAE